jgi:hypothetical protein
MGEINERKSKYTNFGAEFVEEKIEKKHNHNTSLERERARG